MASFRLLLRQLLPNNDVVGHVTNKGFPQQENLSRGEQRIRECPDVSWNNEGDCFSAAGRK